MKPITPILAIALLATLPVGIARAQSSPAAASKTSSPTAAPSETAAARPEVYHVHFSHAAPGKAKALGDSLKAPDPTAPMPGHAVVLRHQDGDSWDYVTIEHLGPKATLEATRPAPPAATRDLSDWHNDTYVNGPAWADFAKAIGINEGAGKSAIYIVSVYRAIPGHREELEKQLGTAAPGDPAAGNVLMQHLEGAPWTFLAISRYATWDDFVKSETNAAAEQAKGSGGWSNIREHSSYHTDTLADRISP